MTSLRIRALATVLIAPLTLAAIAIAQLWASLGDGLAAPISWDHGAHIGKAILTADLLPALRGWTDLYESGLPLNTVYSVGGPLWVLLFRLPTPWLEWHQTYALAFAAFRILVGLAPYRLARAAGGSRLGAFFAGLIALADHGDHSEGGWFYDVTYGVWPMSLSMCFLFFGLADLIESRAPAKIVGAAPPRSALVPRAGLFFGAALVMHQVPLVALLSLLPLWILTRFFDGDRAIGKAALAVIGSVALGVAIAGFWVLPMVLQSGWVSGHGQLYRSFAELGRGAAAGEMVLRAGPWTAILVAIAVLRALFVGGTRRFLALASVLMIAVSARTWLLELDVLRFVPGLGNMMFPRFLMIAKPMEFVLAGLMVGELAEPVLESLKKAIRTPRGLLGVGLAVLLVAPFARGLGKEIFTRIVVRELDTTSTVPLWRDFLQYAEWQRAQGTSEHYRIVYFNLESHLFQAIPAYTGRPAHKPGKLIAETFGNLTESADPAALREMNVRYVVSVGRPPGGLAARAVPVRTFGRIVVSELRDWERSLVFDAGDRGTAAAPRVVAQERARVVVEPRGARRLVMRRALGPGWRADVDGRHVEVEEWDVPGGSPLRFCAVDVPVGARRVTFQYAEWRWFDVIGALLTAVGLLVALLGLRPQLVPKGARTALLGAADRLRRTPKNRLAFALALAVGLVVVAAAVRSAGTYRFASHLEDAIYAIETQTGERVPCTEARPDGAAGVACAIAPWLWLGTTVQAVEVRLHSCIWAHPPPGQQIGRITFPRARLGTKLVVGGGVGDDAQGGDGPPVVLRVSVDGRALGTIDAPWRSHWVERTFTVPSGEHRVDFEVSAEQDARRFFCFDATSH